MTTPPLTLPQTRAHEHDFQTDQVLPIVGGHFIHDTYTAFVPPLLPVIIERLSLSLAQAGSLTAILQAPALLNPLIGYLADKTSVQFFVILAPAVTATLISSLGLAGSYWALAALLFITGISVAAFHAPAPAMIARASGRKLGLGMSLFMASGELGRTVGPLLAVWAVSLWTLDGFFRVVVLGWAATALLFWRLHSISAQPAKPGSLRAALPMLRNLFLPLAVLNLFRNFLLEGISTYLPTYFNQEGASLWVGGAALSLLELAGVGGALVSGPLSDRLGRRRTLAIAILGSSLLMVGLLNAQGWLLVPVLLLMGFVALSATPVMLAMVQEQMPDNRAVGNGVFMVVAFLMRTISTLTLGALGDSLGLRLAFYSSAAVNLLALPVILWLPGKRCSPD